MAGLRINKNIANCPNCPYFNAYDSELDVCDVCGLGRTRGKVTSEDEQDYVRRIDIETKERYKYFRRLHRRFFLTGRKGRLLDVGCADALLVDIFEKNGWLASGIDTFRGLDVSDLRLRKTQLLELNDSEKYDLIAMVHSFEHMPEPDKILKKCAQLLSSDGQVLIVVPNLSGSWSRITGREWHMRNTSHHYFHYTKPSLNRFLMQQGFEITAVKSYSGYAPSPSQSRRAIRKFYEKGIPSIQPFRSALFRLNNLARPVHNFIVDRFLDGAELQVLASKKKSVQTAR